MELIATKQAAQARLDRLAFVRSDGTRAEIDLPRQGVLPHDLVHWVVESGLALRGGFLSLVAAGGEPRFVMERAHQAPGAAAATIERAAVQAEALVEALQTQLWSGAFDAEAFDYGVETAARARGIEPPPRPGADAARALFDHAVDLNARWAAVPPQQSLHLRFESAR